MKKNIWIFNHYAIPPSMGGLNRHYYFSKYLSQMGYNVRIFTSARIHNTDLNMIKGKERFRVADCDGVEYTFIRGSAYKGNGVARILNMLEFPLRAGGVCKAFARRYGKPDVIYTSSPNFFAACRAVWLARGMGVPCLMEVRDLWPESVVAYNGASKNNPMIRLMYRMEKWIYKNAAGIVFTIPAGKQYLYDKGWDRAVGMEKVYHINNGVDLEEFYANAAQWVLRDEDLEDTSRFKLAYTGSIRKANNIGLLVDVALELKAMGSRAKILLWGSGEDAAGIAERIRQLGLDNIALKGRVEKKYIPSILQKTDANLMHLLRADAQKYGLSANKLFDYLAAGKPILSDVPVPCDIVAERQCGIVVDDQHPRALAQAILKLENLPGPEYNAYCQNALAAAREYDFKELSGRLASILEKLPR